MKMRASLTPDRISSSDFTAQLAQYPDTLSENVIPLEASRDALIAAITAEKESRGNANNVTDSSPGVFLDKRQVKALVDWKLKHGTFRPTLATLVNSNTEEAIESTTRSAFAILNANPDDSGKAISTLSSLKGIGVATASLILCCYDPISVPFFSDELFRWLHWEALPTKNEGWDRKISYTIKEYNSLKVKAKDLRERLSKDTADENVVKAIDLEKVAYAIAKSALREGQPREKKEGKDSAEPKRAKPRKRRAGADSKQAPDAKREKKILPATATPKLTEPEEAPTAAPNTGSIEEKEPSEQNDSVPEPPPEKRKRGRPKKSVPTTAP